MSLRRHLGQLRSPGFVIRGLPPPPQYTGDIQEGKEGRRGTYHLFLIRRGLLAAETEEADMIVTDLVTSLLCEGAQYSPLNYRKI